MEGFGPEVCYSTVNTQYNAVTMLDDTHVVVAYCNTGGSNYGCVKIGVIGWDTVTWGAESVFNTASVSSISISTLDPTHFVVAYRDDGHSGHGTAIVGSVSGDTITYGTENVFYGNSTYYVSVSALDDTHFVVIYKNNNTKYGTSIIGLVSGTTILNYGTPNTYGYLANVDQSVSALDSTHFVIGYYTHPNGKACIGSVSGTTISLGSVSVFDSHASYNIATSILDSTHFAVAYHDYNTGYGCTKVGIVSGTTITGYTTGINTFNRNSTTDISVSGIDNTKFVVAYRDNGSGSKGQSRLCTFLESSNTIDFGVWNSEETFNDTVTEFISVLGLPQNYYIVVYSDVGGDSYGCARIYGEQFCFGDESCYSTVNTDYSTVAMLDSTHVVVAYSAGGDGKAKVGRIHGNTVTWGTEFTFNSGSSSYISIDTLDSTHFVVVYRGTSNYGHAKIGMTNGGTTILSFGSEATFSNVNTVYISVTSLDSTHFAVGYRYQNSPYGGYVRVGLVSGTHISSYGAQKVFCTGIVSFIKLDTLDTTHFVVLYNDSMAGHRGVYARVGLVAGTTISSYGADAGLMYSSTYSTALTCLDSTHFVGIYLDALNQGVAKVGSVAGTTISLGNLEVIGTGLSHPSATTLDSSHFVVAYNGSTKVGVVDGITIDSIGTENILSYNNISYKSVVAINSSDYIVVYCDDDIDKGCARVWDCGDDDSGNIIPIILHIYNSLRG